MSKSNDTGRIIKIAGPVVDVRFGGSIPNVNEALSIDLPNKRKLILEVAFIIGDKEVKTLALGSTDGLKRGIEVKRTKSPIKVPVGMPTLGRIFNVLGDTIDGGKSLSKGIKYEWRYCAILIGRNKI